MLKGTVHCPQQKIGPKMTFLYMIFFGQNVIYDPLKMIYAKTDVHNTLFLIFTGIINHT